MAILTAERKMPPVVSVNPAVRAAIVAELEGLSFHELARDRAIREACLFTRLIGF